MGKMEFPISGDYKLTEHYDTGALELYNLGKDIGETTNLAKVLPGKSAERMKSDEGEYE